MYSAILRFSVASFTIAAVSAQNSTSNGSSPCAMVAAQQADLETDYPSLDAIPLNATLAYECARSVELVKEDALQYLEYAKAYSQYHTTLIPLKNPPESYLQPGVDVLSRLDEIADKVNNGTYSCQYHFDVELALLARAVNDFHFNLRTGVVGQALFAWVLPYTLTSYSVNGTDLPKVYVWEDVFQGVSSPSAIATVEGMTINEYLVDLGTNWDIVGVGESHAEWNIMMRNGPYSFGGGQFFDQSLFGNRVLYRGDSINGTFENGTAFTWSFSAYSQWNLTGQGFDFPSDIYEKMVLVSPSSGTTNTTSKLEKRQIIDPSDQQILPDDFVPVDIDVSPYYQPYPMIAHESPSTNLSNATVRVANNFPTPDIAQEPFGDGKGVVSGYLLNASSLNDSSICVVSLPSFETGDEDEDKPPSTSFSKAVADTLIACKKANMTKVVVDVSGNGGGSIYQGYDTFKHFFPDLDPYQLVRSTASSADDAFGKFLTPIMVNEGDMYGSELQSQAVSLGSAYTSDQAATSFNQNNQSWSSWQDLFGPVQVEGANYTNPLRYDFNTKLDPTRGGLDQDVFGFGNNTIPSDYPRWAASDIIIVGDGFCGSTCAVFHELMKSVGGVKSVVFGGLPTYGPMQVVSGTRGANVFTWNGLDELAENFRLAANYSSSEVLNITQEDLEPLPPPLSELRYDGANSSRFNKLDIVRKGDDTSLQFIYEPAVCRIFYTREMIMDQTQVWLAGAKVASGDMSMCVMGSTNQMGSGQEVVTTSPGFDNSFQAAKNGVWAGNETWGTP